MTTKLEAKIRELDEWLGTEKLIDGYARSLLFEIVADVQELQRERDEARAAIRQAKREAYEDVWNMLMNFPGRTLLDHKRNIAARIDALEGEKEK